jgi:hypothetical protein
MAREYVPTSLRQPKRPDRETAFAIGDDDGCDGIGMWYGPVPTLNDVLEQVGHEDSVIVRHNANWTDEIIWWWKVDRWVEVEQETGI